MYMFRSTVQSPLPILNTIYVVPPLDTIGNIRDFGFILFSDLSFNFHVDAVYNKSLLYFY